MKLSKMYMPTLRENPAEAEIPSHQLLLRAGMTRRLVSGIYSYLPLGYRVIKKIEKVVREEMDKSNSQEVLLSAVQPREIWESTGRWEDFGPEMFKLHDRHDRDFCLGPTHEEYLLSLIKDEIKSYKQLPLNLYQIQTKYRDEKRPRFGLIRSREFIMKDAYSFDLDKEGMMNSYKEMWDAYDAVFTRLNLKYKVVAGDSGAMGGNESHEFMAMSDIGESLVAYCDACDYAATDEKADILYSIEEDEDLLEMEKIHTPGATTIDDLEELFKVSRHKFAKAVVYQAGDEVVVVLVPGNREINEIKLINYLGIGEHELEMADDETIRRITQADKGYTGPIGLAKEARLIVDKRITQIKNFIVGGNESEYHIKNVNYGRDFEGEVVEDLLLVQKGDICPKCGKELSLDRGIEVGNIFQLGTKYSQALNGNYLDENGKDALIYMGSYGIGISRTMSAIVEQNHDEHGIIWPLVVAPYQVIVSVINIKDQEQMELGEKIYEDLKAKGYEVILDDRKGRAGVKFNDRDLIGIPLRITVGRNAGEGIVEFSTRRENENQDIKVEEILGRIEEEFEKEGLRK